MTTVIIDVETMQLDNLTIIDAKSGNQVIRSTLASSKLQTVDDLAAWLLAQTGRESLPDVNLQKRLTIDYHIDQVIDPITSMLVDQTVIDNVASEPLPADDGRTNFEAMPGWSTWTAGEAETWVDTNVTDLPSAIVALKAMAKAIIFLRNITV